ncbi:Isochorismatase hydrolase [Cubamyces lactineus]|nr:Isochorismatase hydrolase [Cubamyces lactineus]
MAYPPKLSAATEYGNGVSFWVEYPTGLIDLTRTTHLSGNGALEYDSTVQDGAAGDQPVPPLYPAAQLEVPVDGDRVIRIAKKRSALLVLDMQNYFLHPDIRAHPSGLACVSQLTKLVPALRAKDVKIIWVNWGLTEHELTTIPPSLVRCFSKGSRGGIGAPLPGDFGRLLMRGEYNTQLYGPLQTMYEEGKRAGTDIWIHKNRMGALWGSQTALDLYLQEQGITTLFFTGINADQCVLGTLSDAYSKGYDCIVVDDCIATKSPAGGLENVLFNANVLYGFVTNSSRIINATT